MERQFVNRDEIPYFSKLTNDLAYRQDKLNQFISSPFSEAALLKQIQLKQNHFSIEKRALLHRVLTQQNELLKDNSLQQKIDSLLDTKTFVVTTGHQLNLLTGPLYTIYKIAHTINLASDLSKKFPHYTILPLFWMASEDHDKEEINHFHLFGKKITWETKQSGPVGQFELDNWNEWQEKTLSLFRGEEHEKLKHLLDIYQGNNLAEANRKLIHALFSDYNLLILDGDNASLKRSFSPIMKKEIEDCFIEQTVSRTNEELSKAGVSPQVFVRPINLFYCEKGLRSRLIPNESTHLIQIEGKGNYSKIELLQLLEQESEKFSPNALLRPLYQEWTLPTIAYVGGGGELAYWLQLKASFEAVAIPYPLISLRNSFQLLPTATQQKMEKTGFSWQEFAQHSTEELKQLFLKRNGNETDFSSIDIKIKAVEQELIEKTRTGDSSLKALVEKEIKSIQTITDGVKKRIHKAEKTKHEVSLQQIERLKIQLFPGTKLQERMESFLPFYLKQEGTHFISTIISICDAYTGDFQLLYV